MSDFFTHPQALVETDQIGKNSRVWAFAHVLRGAVIGEDCNICDHTYIEGDVRLGDRVTVKSGVQLWNGITVEDDVFIGPNATFDNDPFPRSKNYPEEFSRTVLRKGCTIGANATIQPGLTIGQYAMISVGSVVMDDVPPYAVVAGNPAQITGYIDRENPTTTEVLEVENVREYQAIYVRGVSLQELPCVEDLTGKLSFAELGKHLPFEPKRYFLVYDVPNKEVRGEHAHLQCHQFLVCVKGSCAVVVDDGHRRQEIRLDRPNLGLHLPPMVWATQYKYTADAVLMVLASEIYEAEDYIRNYDDYLETLKSGTEIY
ncbi:MAG: WxcM-like domain-containing protein [Anaerolineaceae bacterium]|jgi:UDP-2-acetamido-3-amino-2,3-dideoxy-glucuronate N-acetyltransferase